MITTPDVIGEAQRRAKLDDGNVKDCKGVLLELGVSQHSTDTNLTHTKIF